MSTLFIVIFVGLIIFGLANFFGQSAAEHKKVEKMDVFEKVEYFNAKREDAEKKKYNNYMFTCPMCGSKKVLKITNADRAVSVAALGAASSKIGKQYICDNCKHKW